MYENIDYVNKTQKTTKRMLGGSIILARYFMQSMKLSNKEGSASKKIASLYPKNI